MRGLLEKIAKTSFQVRKDPGDSALFYLALGKRSTLLALYKSVKDQKLVDFLQKDLESPKVKADAAKNAYFLQGRHRYELAAAFFLLAGSLKDAVHGLIQYHQKYFLADEICLTGTYAHSRLSVGVGCVSSSGRRQWTSVYQRHPRQDPPVRPAEQ